MTAQSRWRVYGNVVCTAVALLLLTALPRISVAGDSVALVTDLQGMATLQRDGTSGACSILLALRAGDQIDVSEGSTLTVVVYESSREMTITGPAKLTLSDGDVTASSGQVSTARQLSDGSGIKLSSAVENWALGALVARSAQPSQAGDLFLVSPVSTNILESRPVFEWHAGRGIARLRFVLLDGLGKVMLETPVEGSSLQLPQDVELQEGVLYSWRLEAYYKSGDSRSVASTFSLLDAQTRAALAREVPASDATISGQVIYAMLLEQAGATQQADLLWKQIRSVRNVPIPRNFH